MKIKIYSFLFSVFLVFSLTSCFSQESYTDDSSSVDLAYDDGYYDGYDDGYYDGSEEGWYDNIDEIGWFFEEEAVHYAAEHGGWHPEEAWGLIEAYQNNEPFYEDGSPPSKQDYFDAIESLIYFYEYFYGKKYSD